MSIRRFAIDSSAVIAILNREDETRSFLDAIDESAVLIGWATVFEIRLWLTRGQRTTAEIWLEKFLALADVEAIAFDQRHEAIARQAARQFSKGLHPAKLNFGDCMAYAVARDARVPLLFKGRDFGLTDIEIHPASAIA